MLLLSTPPNEVFTGTEVTGCVEINLPVLVFPAIAYGFEVFDPRPRTGATVTRGLLPIMDIVVGKGISSVISEAQFVLGRMTT